MAAGKTVAAGSGSARDEAARRLRDNNLSLRYVTGAEKVAQLRTETVYILSDDLAEWKTPMLNTADAPRLAVFS
ncbi:MAG TPA: hypothetical protein VGL59_25595 [Polyangia bacterium]|jgi:hypothetical protein